MTRRAPTTAQLVIQLKALTRALEERGAQAEQLAPLLAARGWPTSSGAAGNRGGNAELTSVEAAADTDPGTWRDIDTKLRWWITTTFALADLGQQMLTTIAARAAADDEHDGRATGQAGTGTCLACDRWVPGTEHDRLRAGFCDTCRKAWERSGRPDRAAFIRNRPKSDDRHPNRQRAG